MKALILAFDPNRPRTIRHQVKDTLDLPEEYTFVNPYLELADQLQRLEAHDWVTFEALRRLVKRELGKYEAEKGGHE